MVQILDGIFGFPCNPQFYEPEASRLAGEFVLNEFDSGDFIALRFEPLLQISLCASKRNVADKEPRHFPPLAENFLPLFARNWRSNPKSR
jgi:hypothetical protein